MYLTAASSVLPLPGTPEEAAKWADFNQYARQMWVTQGCRPLTVKAYKNYSGTNVRHKDRGHIYITRDDGYWKQFSVIRGQRSFFVDMVRYVIEGGHSRRLLRRRNSIYNFFIWWRNHWGEITSFLESTTEQNDESPTE